MEDVFKTLGEIIKPETEKQYYEVCGTLSNSDEHKTIVIEIGGPVISRNDAMDYAAMFHSIDEIKHIRQGRLIKGIFTPTNPLF